MSTSTVSSFPKIERLFGGQPLIAPRGHDWQSGVTFNSAAVHLPATEENIPVIRELLGPDEPVRDIVALHYRARPQTDPGYPFTRSYVGLSLHETNLKPIRRLEEPVLSPEAANFPDIYGAEDPRIAKVDGTYWMTYCGVQPFADEADPLRTWLATVCIAKSDNLVDWTKLGTVEGLSGRGPIPVSNKDGVLFPDRIEDKVVMLHRPMAGEIGTWETAISVADVPEGPYTDLGSVHGAAHREGYLQSWCGAGAVPIKIGEGRYLSIEHTGNYLPGKQRKYVLDAFLYDFNDWDPTRPETLVKARLDDFMRPETDFEIKSPFEESVANVVFACGAYVAEGWIYIVYGGGDSYILAARVRLDEMVEALESREETKVREASLSH